MKKSSNICALNVNADSQELLGMAVDLKEIDLDSIIKMGLQDFMFQVGMLAVQQVMQAEVETLAGPRYSRLPGRSAYRWGTQQGAIHISGQKVNTDKARVVRKGKGGKLEEFYARRFDDREFVVILIDGIGVADVDNIVAMGIDVWGQKQVLGIRQGASENTRVCTDLLEDLLDGAKALSKAVKKLFGDNAVIQRCQVHKRRNVLDNLPKEHQTRIDKRLAAAYGMNTEKEARKALEAVFEELIGLSESAAASFAEGMEETLTVNKLALSGALRRKLSTTNAIESMFSMARRYKRNVKKWNGSKHIERTLVVTLLEAERRFHRVEGYRGLKDLQAQIKNLRATTCNTKAA